MKLNELKDKKIVHICVIIGIIVLILLIAGIVMLRYQVEGEKDLPFKLSKMIIVSTAEGTEIEAIDNNKWNFSVNQDNDIYLSIEKNLEHKSGSNLKNITLENFNIIGENGTNTNNIKLYRANSSGQVAEDEKYLVQNNINYKADKETNLDDFKIANQGGIILLRSVNENLCEVRNNEESIIHDGTLLKKGNVNPDNLKYKLSFDIIIETTKNIKYKGNIEIELPTGDIETEGKAQLEKNDFSDVVFKRI